MATSSSTGELIKLNGDNYPELSSLETTSANGADSG